MTDKEIEELQQAVSDARQNASIWQGRCERIAVAMTRDGIIEMAHECAREIENIFVAGHWGSRDNRLLAIEKAIRRRISIASNGESYWQD